MMLTIAQVIVQILQNDMDQPSKFMETLSHRSRRGGYGPRIAVTRAVAVGGGAYAAVHLPANSVGTKQLRDNAVVSSKVKNGSLLSIDFEAGQLPRGPTGPPGQRGQNGTNGTNGSPGPAGTARAYALVSTSGGHFANMSHNVTTVTHANGTGIYCVELDPSVAASGTAAIASPNYQSDDTSTGTPGVFAYAEYAGGCATNGVQVNTYRVIPGTSTSNGSTSHADEGSS